MKGKEEKCCKINYQIMSVIFVHVILLFTLCNCAPYETINLPEKLPQFANASEADSRLYEMLSRRQKYPNSNIVEDKEIKRKVPFGSMPPFFSNFQVSKILSSGENLPKSESWNIIFGVLAAKTNTKYIEWKQGIASILPKCRSHQCQSQSKKFEQAQLTVEIINEFLLKYYGKVLSSNLVPIPNAILSKWMIDDLEFSRQRLAGQHPCMIKAWVDDEKLPFEMSSFSLREKEVIDAMKDARDRKQLFVCDYEFLQVSADMVKPGCILPSPIAIFHVDKRLNELMPLGIYFRTKSMLVTPKDKPIMWFLAKLHVQCADNHYQQFYHHLPFTHWVLEPIALAAKYALPDSHPIGRLLRPHFRGIFQINWLSRTILANKGGIIDEVMSSGRIGAFALSTKAYQSWNFKARSFQTEIFNRGVNDPKLLPYYPYRDCGKVIDDAFRAFITKIVYLYYKGDDMIVGDWELQTFASEMHSMFAKTRTNNDDFGIPNAFRTRAELIDFLGNLLFTVSIQHSILNYADLEFHGFIPNSPTLLHTDIPDKENANLVLEDIVRALPTLEEGVKLIGFAKLLSNSPNPESTIGQANLVDRYGFQERFANAYVREFQAILCGKVTEKIRSISDESTRKYGFPYDYMLPEKCTFGVQI